MKLTTYLTILSSILVSLSNCAISQVYYGKAEEILPWGEASYADFNGDGRVEMVKTVYRDRIRVFEQELDGSYTSYYELPLVVFEILDIDMIDVENDGDLDIIAMVSEHGVQSLIYCYLNDGDGVFESPYTLSVGLDIESTFVKIVDMDGDGFDDIVTDTLSEMGCLRNNGDGGFDPEVVLFTLPLYYFLYWKSIEFADVDADGDMDVIAFDNNISLYRQSSNLIFDPHVQIVDINLTPISFIQIYFDLLMMDADGDDDLDLYCSISTDDNSNTGNYFGLLKNDGTGNFIPGFQYYDNEDVYGLNSVDWNNDGLLDLATSVFDVMQIKIFLNVNGVVDQIGTSIFQNSDIFGYPSFLDVDGDSDNDLIIRKSDSGSESLSTDFSSVICLNNGAGELAEPFPATWGAFSSQNLIKIDMDLDGTDDILYNARVTTTHIALNVLFGNGNSYSSPIQIAEFDGPFRFDVGDFNLDGYTDILVIDDIVVKLLLRNGSDLSFTEWALPALFDVNFVRDFKIGDVNNDGFLDVVICPLDSFSTGYLLFNIGAGSFLALPLPNLDSPKSCCILDANGDEFLDVIIVSGISRVFFSDQNAILTEQPYFSTGGTNRSCYTHDLDFDGDMDVILNNNTNSRWVENDGEGNFTGYHSICDGTLDRMNWKDMNGDGFNDIVAISNNPEGVIVCLNDGSGVYEAPIVIDNIPLVSGAINTVDDLYAYDMNDDGKSDIVASTRNRLLVYYDIFSRCPNWNAEIGDNVSICIGDSVTLIASGGEAYSWQDFTASSSLTVSPEVFSTYNVTVMNDIGCIDSLEVSVDVLPVPSIIYIHYNSGVLSGANGVAYQWYYEGVPIEGATSSTYIPTQLGSYSVMGFNSVLCGTMSDMIEVDYVGISEVNSGGISIFPNPGKDMFRIIQSNLDIQTIVVSDITGKQICSFQPQHGVKDFSLPYSIGSGQYFIRIFDLEGNSSVFKWMVE